MGKVTRKKSGVGRPSGVEGAQVQAALLQAARSLFLSNDFKAVSIRQIAVAAGVNGAMVNYYFGNKQGLYLAMVDELSQSLQAGLDGLPTGTEITIATFSATYCRLLVANPWWPNFVIREVLFSEGEIRSAVIQKLAAVFAPKLLQSIKHEIANGHFRADLNPALVLTAVMGMTVFPFLAKPVLEQVLGLKVDSNFADQLSEHNIQLFLYGAQNPSKRSSRNSPKNPLKNSSKRVATKCSAVAATGVKT